MWNVRFWVLVLVTTMAALATVVMRVLPHPDNFVPLLAVAIFGGAMFRNRLAGIAVPLMTMIVSDFVLFTTKYRRFGLAEFQGQLLVYVAIVACAVMAMLFLGKRRSPARIAATAIASSVLFYLLTNFVWFYRGEMYPRTWDGLVACYVAALPFFRNSLAADLLYTAVLFGGFALAEWKWNLLREPQPAVAHAA